MEDSKSRLGQRYDRAAWFYETGAGVYSTGQIYASKKDQLKEIRADDRVLFLGVGAGEDALLAVEAGARVTCVDISRRMLDQFQIKLDRRNLSAELICESALDHHRPAYYDVCCANYFLNTFRRETMLRMMCHAATLVRGGGKFLIADVATPHGNFVSRAFNRVYLTAAMAGSVAIGLVRWHEVYDYPEFFSEAGLQFSRVEHFRFARLGPVVYQNIVATRASELTGVTAEIALTSDQC